MSINRNLKNGAVILAIDYISKVVLAVNEGVHHSEYITWQFNTRDGYIDTFWGHYYMDDYPNAKADFLVRSANL